MRKSYLVLFILLFMSGITFASCYHGDEFTERCTDCDEGNWYMSRTFMMTRPVSHNIFAEQSLWHDFLYHKRDKGGSFQVTTYYQQSIKRPETAKYFTFGYKTLLKVLGDDNHDACFRDIRAEWLGLPSNFRGAFSIDPEQRQFACVISYNHDLKSVVDYDFLKRFWFEISLPIVVVENNMNLCQCDVFNRADQFPRDILNAFNQSSWRYAKINGKISHVDLAPIRIRFGGAFMDEDNDQLATYSVFSLPTGHSNDNKYLFEPQSDYNGHLGFGTGANFQIVINRKECRNCDICFFLNLETIFLIRNWHCRTFDLKCRPTDGDCPSCGSYCAPCPCGTVVGGYTPDGNCARHCAPCNYKPKPWSRYLLFNTKNGVPNQNVPGVNVLTKRVKVRPYNMVEFSTGFRVKAKRFEGEVGYSIWGHGAERIECIERFRKQWGIAGNDPGDMVVKSASLSTICCRKATPAEEFDGTAGPVFIPICESDLDLDSAACPGALNHIVHCAGGFEHEGECVDVLVGLGLYYDIPQKNSALKTWGFWVKFGGSF